MLSKALASSTWRNADFVILLTSPAPDYFITRDLDVAQCYQKIKRDHIK